MALREIIEQKQREVEALKASGLSAEVAPSDRSLEAAHPRLRLAGNAVAGVSVDQVIARGRAVARELVEEDVR